ncbi:unnamed protein product [Phytophthora lilii]|uniref:Unnamed protein product n=1 Tax=Phytophthora lilii TaxID=2077276 RepID=A0A9W6TZI0_9STRA|nr:unnamed protein product [Phytophthora lilii]
MPRSEPVGVAGSAHSCKPAFQLQREATVPLPFGKQIQLPVAVALVVRELYPQSPLQVQSSSYTKSADTVDIMAENSKFIQINAKKRFKLYSIHAHLTALYKRQEHYSDTYARGWFHSPPCPATATCATARTRTKTKASAARSSAPRARVRSPNQPLPADYDEYYDDYEPTSPNSSTTRILPQLAEKSATITNEMPHLGHADEFMYRRDSPSRQRSVFSFVQQEESEHQLEQELTAASIEDPGDAEILQAMVPQVQQAVGSRFSTQQITQELRSANYDLDKAVVALLEKAKAPVAAGGVLPLQIQIPRLETVAMAIGNEQKEAKPKKEIVMPAPAKAKAMAIGGAMPSPPKKAEEEKKAPRMSAADAANAAPAISRAQTQFTPAEKKAFNRAELKTQEQAAKLEEEARSGGKTKISMVVIGHVDAGKSTITGHLLYKLGYVSKRLMHKYEKESREAGKSSFAYAWVMDADEEERSRGVTMDVGTSHFETATKHVTLLDAPGHRDFIPKMIAGAAQADVAVLVVPAVTGEFEAAFENSGQTKEHTLLVRSLGVSQMVVAVNKMDMVDWDKERFDNIVKSLSTFLQGAGFRPKNLRFVPLSGMTGANLEKTGGVKECSWYAGPSLVEAIGK